MKKEIRTSNKTTPDEARKGAPVETYLAPPPPSKGSIVGIDCHSDTFTAAVFRGTTPHDARQTGGKGYASLESLLAWAETNFSHRDLFVLEAGSNSFEIHRHLARRGLRALVLESAYVGKQAKVYADNDKIAAARIVMVYLAGKAPCVWVPDETTRVRRELLHAYNRAVKGHTEATNSFKGYLNQMTIRPGKRNLAVARTREWILAQRDWTPVQRLLLEDHFTQIDRAAERRKTLRRAIAQEVANDPRMLGLMSLLGIGVINAFALMAIIGEIGRFHTPRKLVAYLGLNPGQRDSGTHKRIKVGVGSRGRRDMRCLLIQGAQAVLRNARSSSIGKWGWRLFARKGNRNTAVAAVARKLATQVWHLLMGNSPELLEATKSRETKLRGMMVTLGKSRRREMGLPATINECVAYFDELILNSKKQLLTTEKT